MNRNVTALILLVLAGGIYFTVTKDQIAAAHDIMAVNTQYTKAIKTSDTLIKERDKVLEDYKNISQDDRDRLEKMLPSTVDNIRLVIDLNSIAVAHGFALKGVTANASTAKNGSGPTAPSAPLAPVPVGANKARPLKKIASSVLDTVNISFSVSAPYIEFQQFMKDLEANLRIMDLTHLTVAANDTGTYDYSVQLTTYWLRQQ